MCDCCPVSGREAVSGEGGGTEGRKEGEKKSGAGEGGMSFTDVPPGCTHSSGAVHPVLSSPTSTRAHTPHCTYARLTHSQTRTTPTAVPTLPTAYSMRQEMVTFFLSFFLSSCTAATTNAPFFLSLSLAGRAVFHYTWTMGNKMVWIS